jgi:tRNA dimethylallyltransferase
LLIAVMGPTASGKTALAEHLAERLDARLVNSDAFQVYRGLDIGTAKSPHREQYDLIDIREPEEPFGVGEWVALAQDVLAGLWRQGKSAVIVGGTGLNVRALFERYGDLQAPPDPELRAELTRRRETEGLQPLVEELRRHAPETAARIDLQNPIRVQRALERVLSGGAVQPVQLPPFKEIKIGLAPPHEAVAARIGERVHAMIGEGWIEEVRGLRAKGVPYEAPGLRAHGYRTWYDHLDGLITFDDAVLQIEVMIRQYAKRQRTWMRSEPRLRIIPTQGVTEPPLEEALDFILDGGQDGQIN